jgi:hypothetical protein
MTSRLFRCLVLLAITSGLGLTAGAPVRADGSLFEPEAPFGKPITVRVTGMPLDQLLSRLSAELGVSLQPDTPDVGDLRVSVFAEDLPASQILKALTTMLNQTPEGGFGWHRGSGRSTATYRLHRSQQARLRAAARVREGESALAAAFLAQIRALKEDPERRKLWERTDPVPRLQRGSLLLASLSDDHLRQLQRDGVLVLRQPEASREQQAIIGRLVTDLRGSIDDFLKDRPEEVPRYENIDPAAASVIFELHGQVPSQSVVIRLNLGPDKGGSRNAIWSTPRGAGGDPGPAADSRHSAPDEPAATAPKITLEPRSWSMADVLSDLARRSRVPVVSDCYTVSWTDLRGLPALPLEPLLDEIGRRCEMAWERRDGFIRLRSRVADARQAAEVPQRLIDRWLAQIERDRALSLETLEELCRLSDAQLFHLRDQWEIGSLIPNLNFLAWSARHPVHLYSHLSPAQRAQAARGGIRIAYSEMSPIQQRHFAFWAMVREPDLAESQYEGGAVRVLLTEEHQWQVTLSLGGRTSTNLWWLGMGRDWNTGAPLPEPPLMRAEELIGRPAPPVTVKSRDGKPRALPLAEGRASLALFREVWVAPYVGPPSDAADLDAVAALLKRRPELRERVAVICSREKLSTLREWAGTQRTELPVYADETGSVLRSFGRGPLPRFVLIDAAGHVERVQSGYQEWRVADWDARLR